MPCKELWWVKEEVVAQQQLENLDTFIDQVKDGTPFKQVYEGVVGQNVTQDTTFLLL